MFVYEYSYRNQWSCIHRSNEVAVFEASNVRYKIGLLYRKGLHSNIATLVLRKPICDTVFYIQMFCVLCSKLVTSVFWPLCFEFWILISIWRGWANCTKCSIIHIPVFVSLHSFFLYRGIRTFAVDLFIAPSKETITILKTYNTEHKRENSKHETQTSKHRSHKLWTQNSKHLHTKHNMYNGSVGRKTLRNWLN